jgi:nitroimidazol reductase NimA-like FMN-containing flavoprotein (pyridoxamine 5'-phosphate oxidase superfamily)
MSTDQMSTDQMSTNQMNADQKNLDQMNRTDMELSAHDSWVLLRQAVVGRLALIVDDQPDIFPVNYKVDHGSVLFRTAQGRKLAGAVGHTVAFEVDGYVEETASAWSVVVKGTAKEVMRLYDVLEAFVEVPLYPWHPSPKSHVIRIEPDSITGRRFQVTPHARFAPGPDAVRHAADE